MARKPCEFDEEVFSNCFICCCKVIGEKDNITFEISERKNQLQEMYDFFMSNKYTFIGYNCGMYDTPIMNMIIQNISYFLQGDYSLLTNAAHKLSSQIVRHDGQAAYEYAFLNYFKYIDLMTMMSSKNLRTSLKSLQVTMCFRNVKEMMIDWSKPIEVDRIDDVIKYCFNDIDSTAELYHLLISDIKLRMDIQKEFKIRCLSKDPVAVGVAIFSKYICEELGIYNEKQLYSYMDNFTTIPVKDFILPNIKFKTKPFQDVLKDFNNLILDDKGQTNIKEWSTTALCGKLRHTFGIGGLHSQNQPNIYKSSDNGEWLILDLDVSSMYPAVCIAWEFGPKGFKEAFLHVMSKLRDGRIEAKKSGNKVKDKSMKLSLNSILGNLRNEYSPYFAPEANTAICVNGQLFLAILIEKLELAGIEVIQSNTDGCSVYIHKSKVDTYYKICKEWEKLTKIDLEFVEYEKMVITGVNDYVAYKKGYFEVKDKLVWPYPTNWIEYNYTFVKSTEDALLIDKYIKTKGFFIPYLRLGKGLDSLIVPKALIDYFGKGIPIKQTILGCDNIWDFIIFQKVGKQYEVMHNQELQQHINRFYVSKKGAYLYKIKTKDKFDERSNSTITVKKPESVLKGYGVTLFNEYEEKPMVDYNIQYEYYIRQATEIIEKLEPRQQLLF